MLLKFKNTSSDLSRRNEYKKTEIFFECCSLLNQSNFSNKLDYFLFKRKNKFSHITRFRNQCLFTGYKKSIISYFKTSRHTFLKKVLAGSMPGFYRAVW